MKLLLKKMKNAARRCFFALPGASVVGFVLFCAVSCASVPNSFYNDNKDDFARMTLANGIPVVFKNNSGSRLIVLRLVFEGGSSVIPAELSGIEKMTLELMLHGSTAFSYEDIQQREYERSFSFSAAPGRDYSTIGFTCIDRDVDEVLAIFTDAVLNPAFSSVDFQNALTETADEIARTKADPSGALGLALSAAAFENHPYRSSVSATSESYPNITLDAVQQHHKSLLNSARMKIVVVGGFDAGLKDDIYARLSESFSAVADAGFAPPEIPALGADGGTVLVANEQAGAIGHVAGFFPCPDRTERDYIPFAIATMYLDDLFYNQVREENGSVYSIGTGIVGGKKILGVISVYRATEKAELKKQICAAIQSFSEEDIKKNLDQYKNRYISSLFGNARTASGIAASIISSLEYFGSETAYLTRPELVQNVRAEDVCAAYRTYILPVADKNVARWIVVGGAETLGEYDF